MKVTFDLPLRIKKCYTISLSTKNKLFHLCNQDYKKMKTPFIFFFFLNFINLTMSIQKEKTKKKKTKQNKEQKNKKNKQIQLRKRTAKLINCTNQPPYQNWLHLKSFVVPSFFALSMQHNPETTATLHHQHSANNFLCICTGHC